MPRLKSRLPQQLTRFEQPAKQLVWLPQLGGGISCLEVREAVNLNSPAASTILAYGGLSWLRQQRISTWMHLDDARLALFSADMPLSAMCQHVMHLQCAIFAAVSAASATIDSLLPPMSAESFDSRRTSSLHRSECHRHHDRPHVRFEFGVTHFIRQRSISRIKCGPPSAPCWMSAKERISLPASKFFRERFVQSEQTEIQRSIFEFAVANLWWPCAC